MFIAAETIRDLCLERSPLVTPTPGITEVEWLDRLQRIEGSAFDLSLGEVYSLSDQGRGHIGVYTRITPSSHSLFTVYGDTLTLVNGFYIFESAESVTLPIDKGAFVIPKTTIFRCGGIMSCGIAHPGYHGTIKAGVWVAHPGGIVIEKGSRFCQLLFYQLEKGKWTDPYEGVWQGRRVGTEGLPERPY